MTYFGRTYADCRTCNEIIYRADRWHPDTWVHLDMLAAHDAYPTDEDLARLTVPIDAEHERALTTWRRMLAPRASGDVAKGDAGSLSQGGDQ